MNTQLHTFLMFISWPLAILFSFVFVVRFGKGFAKHFRYQKLPERLRRMTNPPPVTPVHWPLILAIFFWAIIFSF